MLGAAPARERLQCTMLAYRHAFHAGSHADVLKHLVFAEVLRHMADKDKAYTLIDTHAGAGGYSLQGRYARKKAEYLTGIAPLWTRDDLPPALTDYVALVREFNGGGELTQYPGSPALAKLLLRSVDRMRLYELHPTDHRILEAYLGERAQTEVMQSDGFESLARDLPPPSRRGVVLMDPSYELKTDYSRVVHTLRTGLERFAQGVFVIWYPHVQLLEAAQLPKRLRATAANAPKGWLEVSLDVLPGRSDGFGMGGSAVFVVNPPFQLRERLAVALPYLVKVLGQHAQARHKIEAHSP